MEVLFLNGMPGTGKSTLANLLLELSPLKIRNVDLQFEHISIGDTLREFSEGKLTSKTYDPVLVELIQPYAELIKSAKPIPHSLVLRLVGYRLTTKHSGMTLIIDGFPRFTEQIDLLNKLLESLSFESLTQIILTTDSDEVLRRITERGTRSGEQQIDLDFIKYRLSEFENNVLPALKLFASNPKIQTIEVDASGSKEDTLLRTLALLRNEP